MSTGKWGSIYWSFATDSWVKQILISPLHRTAVEKCEDKLPQPYVNSTWCSYQSNPKEYTFFYIAVDGKNPWMTWAFSVTFQWIKVNLLSHT